MPIFSAALIAQLKRHEGFYAEPYVCPAGKATIGYGTNLEAHPIYIPYEDIASSVRTGRITGAALVARLKERGMRWTKERAEEAMLEELTACHDDLLRRCPAYAALRADDERARADALLNMAFNMGTDGLFKFKKALATALSGDYAEAAAEMKDSLWYRQVGRRSVELCEQMRSGRYREGT